MLPLLCVASLAATPYLGAEWRPLSGGTSPGSRRGHERTRGRWARRHRPSAADGLRRGVVLGPHRGPRGGRRRPAPDDHLGRRRVHPAPLGRGPTSGGPAGRAPPADRSPAEPVAVHRRPHRISRARATPPTATTKTRSSRPTAPRPSTGCASGRSAVDSGFGADLALTPGVARRPADRGGLAAEPVSTQDPSVATSWLAAEGALLLELHWERRADDATNDPK